jgi:hypothetical protein
MVEALLILSVQMLCMPYLCPHGGFLHHCICNGTYNVAPLSKITHKARVKFSVGTYVDMVDCNVAPLTACHLLLDPPWQFDNDTTHGGCSNCYSFVHKGIHHVFKQMLESGIKFEISYYYK